MKPKPSELLAAAGRAVPDVIAPRLRVLFCAINPSLYSGSDILEFIEAKLFLKALAKANVEAPCPST